MARRAAAPGAVLPHPAPASHLHALTSLPAPLGYQVGVLLFSHHIVDVALLLQLERVQPFLGGVSRVGAATGIAPPQGRQFGQGGRAALGCPLAPAPAWVHGVREGKGVGARVCGGGGVHEHERETFQK